MNLLITRHDKIGDFVLTLPMIKIAKEQIRGAKIIVLVSKVNYDFAKEIEFIDEVVMYDKNPFLLARKLKKYNIDASISAFTDTNLAIALLLAGIKTRISPATKIAQIFANQRIKQRRSLVKKREFEYNIDLLRALKTDIGSDFERPILKFDQSKNEILKNFKEQFNINNKFEFVAFHPGFGGSSDGNLSLDDYVRLAKSINDERLNIVFTFGPDDEEAFEYIRQKNDFGAILYRSNLSLIDFCKLLSNFKIFISTSTGPMHLAGAVNITTLSFFGNSLFASDKRWGSINESKKQNNFCIPKDYNDEIYQKIQDRLKEIINA